MFVLPELVNYCSSRYMVAILFLSLQFISVCCAHWVSVSRCERICFHSRPHAPCWFALFAATPTAQATRSARGARHPWSLVLLLRPVPVRVPTLPAPAPHQHGHRPDSPPLKPPPLAPSVQAPAAPIAPPQGRGPRTLPHHRREQQADTASPAPSLLLEEAPHPFLSAEAPARLDVLWAMAWRSAGVPSSELSGGCGQRREGC